jgi:hypothetical protein
MASADLSRRVEKVVSYPPLVDLDDGQRREFHEALLDADAFEDLPGKWQAAIVRAERNRPRLRVSTATEPGLQTWTSRPRPCVSHTAARACRT